MLNELAFPALVALLDSSVHSPEAHELLAGVEFLKSSPPFSGKEPSPTSFYYSAPKLGFELCCDERGNVMLVSFFAAGAKRGFYTFPWPLLHGLTFQSRPRDVKSALGLPARSGPEQVLPKIGRVGPWDRFDWERFALHVQYTPSGNGIVVVTAMSLEAVP